jgi:hypothetical protein
MKGAMIVGGPAWNTTAWRAVQRATLLGRDATSA